MSAALGLPDPTEDVSLKSLGLAVLSYIVQAVTAEDADVLGPAIKELADYAATLPPRALFDNWAPGASRHAVPLVLDGSYTADRAGKAVDGGAVAATSSSEKSGGRNGADAALKAGSECWISSTDAASSWWQIRLAAPTYLQHAEVSWRVDAASKSLPETYTVSTSPDGTTWTPVAPATTLDNLEKTAMSRQRVALDVVTQYLRVEMNGYAKNTPAEVDTKAASSSAAKEKAHGIKSVALFVPDTLSVHVGAGASLYDLEKMLYNAATGSAAPELVASALRGLQALALASGSAQGMFKLVAALLALQSKASGGAGGAPDRFQALASAASTASAALGLSTLPASLVSGDLATFARGLDEATNEELETVLMGRLAGSGGAGGSGTGKQEAKFDRECMSSSGWELSNDDTWAKTTSSSRIAVYATRGFSSGKVAWEFKSEVDTSGDEYLCYGCGIKPKSNDAYDSSSNLWMIRAYNGKVHQKGSSGRTVDKIRQGMIVRFELDCAAGTVQCWIDGNDQGVVFDNGLAGEEVYPALCGYGSSRTASIQLVEVLSGSGGGCGASAAAAAVGAVVNVVALPGLASGGAKDAKETSTGHYFNDGTLEEAGDARLPIVVAGDKRAAGISLRPEASTGTAASVTYPLAIVKAEAGADDKGTGKGKDKSSGKDGDKTHKPFDYFVARIGVDDTSVPPEFTGEGAVRPVVIAVALDGREVYASAPLATPGETHFVRLPIAGAGKLTVTARFADGDAASKAGARVAAKTVLCQAAVINARDWAWATRRAGSLPSFLDSSVSGSGPAATADGVVAVPSTPLSMARLILSRLAFLAEAHNEVSRRGAAALLKVARATGVDITACPAEVEAAGRVFLAAAAAKSKPKPSGGKKDDKASSSTEPEPFTEGDLESIASLRRLQSPFVLDVCAATFAQLRSILVAALPHVWAENGDLTAGDLPVGALNDADEATLAAKRPWTAIARYVLTITKAHLRRLVVSGVEPASVGIFVASGGAAGAGDAGAAAAPSAALSPVEAAAAALRAAIAADLAARGDVTSTHTRTASGAGALTVAADAKACAKAAVEGQFRAGGGAYAGGRSTRESTLAPVHRLLQFVIEDEEADMVAAAAATGKPALLRSRIPPYVQSAAADAIDAGLAVLYPTQAERRALLSGLISKGGVCEVQFRFPATRTDAIAQAAIAQAAAMKAGGDKDGKKGSSSSSSAEEKKRKEEREKAADALLRKMTRDPRPDRALLLLQMECDRLGLPVFVYGQWGSYVHAVVDLSGSSKQAVEFLDTGFASVFERAGLGKWTIPTGSAEPFVPLKIERIADFASPDRAFTDGIGLVRIYPRSAASFDDINNGVQAVVAGYAAAPSGAAGGAAGAASGVDDGARGGAAARGRKGPTGSTRRVIAVAR